MKMKTTLYRTSLGVDKDICLLTNYKQSLMYI